VLELPHTKGSEFHHRCSWSIFQGGTLCSLPENFWRTARDQVILSRGCEIIWCAKFYCFWPG